MRVLPSALATALVSVVLATAPVSAAPPPEPRTAAVAESQVTRVVVISVDGLNPDAITQLGRSGAPTFHRIVDEGATTFNARSEVEMTNTLPNHTGMVTSRRIDLLSGGHGVNWNDDRLVPRTVQMAAGQRVGSVFSSLEAAGLDSSLFAAKGKFDLFTRSWPNGVDHTLIRGDNTKLVAAARRDLRTTSRALMFLHISLPDVAGHHHGWFSPAYMDAVRESDYLVGRVLKTITRSAESRDHTMVVLTADHGGSDPSHLDPRRYANFRVPFMVWGAGVAAGADLYAINPTYADPGKARVGYDAELQPVRNGDVGNLVLDVLGLPPIPDSEHDYAQDLEVGAP